MIFCRDIEPTLAKKVAQGDVDPISLLAMVDINPSFMPRTVKPLPLTSTDLNQSAKDKGKLPAKLKTENILNFFSKSTHPHTIVGANSCHVQRPRQRVA